MAEIDLVPPRYRRWLMLRSWGLRLAVVYLVVAVGVGAARAVLAARTSGFDREIESLEVERARVEEERRRREGLAAEEQRLRQHLRVLDGLRGGLTAKQMFLVIDESLNEGVYFRRWEFRRAGEIVERPPQAVDTGYFIVLPKDDPAGPERAWRLRTHMEILAQADDHADLAGFVGRLSRQPSIESARILNTRKQRGQGASRVDFELALVVENGR